MLSRTQRKTMNGLFRLVAFLAAFSTVDIKPCLAHNLRLSDNSFRRQLDAVFSEARGIFHPFMVNLKPTCKELTFKQVNQISISIRAAMIDQYFGKTVERGQGLELEYVVLSGIEAVWTNSTDCTSTITINEGVVKWNAPADNAPSQLEVDTWAQQAVSELLVSKLPNSLRFVTLVDVPEGQIPNSTDSSTFNVENGDGSGGPGDNLQQDVLTNDKKISSSSSSNKGKIVAISSVLVAASTIFALGALLMVRARTKAHVYPYLEENSSTGSQMDVSSTKSPDSDEHQDISPVLTAAMAVQQHSRSGSSDSHSLAGSESSWTVGTEAGDSMALKSIASNPPKQAHSWPAMPSAESFEYDRPVNLRKDMLTSAWSGHLPSHNASKNDSVLQPSHFSASQERRRRRLEDDVQLETGSADTPSSKASTPSKGSSSFKIVGWQGGSQRSDSSKEQSNGFVFSSANAGEDIVMIPPRPKARSSPGHMA